MSNCNVTIPFIDVINAIIILERGKHYEEVTTLVRDVVRYYSGDYNLIEEDINDIFGVKGYPEMSERYPEEYKILKKVFGAIIWSD